MEETNNTPKNPKHGKIASATAVLAAVVFFWDIYKQARSLINTEERITKLEDQIRELEKRK